MAHRKVKRIILHHSGGESGNEAQFRKQHMLVNGWKDTGYHYVIGNGSLSRNGQVEIGRPTSQAGAHCKWNNSDSIGICLVGEFTSRVPSAEQYVALIRLLAVECASNNLNPLGAYKNGHVISGHRDWRATDCPGNKFYALLGAIRRDVARQMEKDLEKNVT